MKCYVLQSDMNCYILGCAVELRLLLSFIGHIALLWTLFVDSNKSISSSIGHIGERKSKGREDRYGLNCSLQMIICQVNTLKE